jgi:glycosyltransferase involved in cell wall biosynthesis
MTTDPLASAVGRSDTGPCRLPGPYLLVVDIVTPVQGDSVAFDDAWAKDLEQHLATIDDLVLATPVVHRDPRPDQRVWDLSRLRGRFSLAPLPSASSTLGAIVCLPRTIARLWTAVGRSRVVHCGVGGWPIPRGCLAVPMARLRRRFLIIYIESAGWRPVPDTHATLRARVRGALNERLARWCLRRADLAFYTSEAYRRSLPPRRPENGHVLHASWVDAEGIREVGAAERAWQARLAGGGPLRVVFAGRLTSAKGVLVLLAAARILRERGVAATLQLLGDGDLASECRRAAAESDGRIAWRGALPYGREFLDVLGGADVLVVPSLSDEQPRVVYDGYSQAVPVIASGTPGLRDCVRENQTGLLVPPGDAQALADALERAARDRAGLMRLGLEALRVAGTLTHRSMHLRRIEIIAEAMRARSRR